MPRGPREIWTSDKRNIIKEWRAWADRHADIARDDSTLGAFYLHLERNRGELLSFSADNKFETVRGWLAEEGLIKI
jgi:hypothetical protein